MAQSPEGHQDWTETERATYPGIGPRPFDDVPPLEELWKSTPAPLPVLAILLIVLYLCLPFVVSVVFLAVLLGIVAIIENEKLYKVKRPVDLAGEMNQFLSNVMQKIDHALPQPPPDPPAES